MATLRNLRNLAKIGISKECHLKVIDNIKNPKFVQKSKMFPF